MRKRIFKIFFWLFGFKSKTTENKKKGTIIILIDGLSFEALTGAIRKGICPTLKRLSNTHKVEGYYCGLPAATTATEALLFYGNNFDIPGFTWYDRALKKFVRGNRSLELTAFEDMFKKKRNLLKDGSVIMGVYSGGATELNMSGRNFAFSRSLYILKTAHYFLMALLYPIQLIRTIYLTLKTLLFYKSATHHSAHETFSKIILGQFSCFLTEVEIMRNTEKIFVDFLLYDEYAHEYGPLHTTTFSTLRLVDKYVKRILNTSQNTERVYEIIVLSDHGQTESIPFDYPHTKSVQHIEEALNDSSYEVIKTYGGVIPTKSQRGLYVVPAGSTLQLYFSDHLDLGLHESKVNALFPSFIPKLLRYEEFGWILVRRDEKSSVLYGKDGSVTFSLNVSPVISGTPFHEMGIMEEKELISSFDRYSTFPNNGDLVLFGNVTKQKKVYSFEKHRGTHGGFYGPMTHPFIMSGNTEIKGDSMSLLFDTIAVHV